jgi:hypothetical protein
MKIPYLAGALFAYGNAMAAGVLQLTATFSDYDHTYSEDSWVSDNSVWITDTFGPISESCAFTASLSDFDTLRLTLAAPEGMRFQYNAHEDVLYSQWLYFARWETASPDYGGNLIGLTAHLEFDGAPPLAGGIGGPMWTRLNGTSMGCDFEHSGIPDEFPFSFQFTSLSLVVDLTPLSLYNLPEQSYLFSGGYLWGGEAVVVDPKADPGPVLALVSVPEPSTLQFAALFTCAVAAFSVLRRRQLRRAV